MAKMSDAEQKELAAELQGEVLKSWRDCLKNGTATAADRKAIADFLKGNGWSLDPSKVPQGLKDLMTNRVKPEDVGGDDPELDVQ